jgi:NitT/TauT family transport system substrate-binding protein
MKRTYWVAGLLVLACTGLTIGAMAASAAPKQQQLTKVTLQLKWVTQAQFAGFYAALE